MGCSSRVEAEVNPAEAQSILIGILAFLRVNGRLFSSTTAMGILERAACLRKEWG